MSAGNAQPVTQQSTAPIVADPWGGTAAPTPAPTTAPAAPQPTWEAFDDSPFGASKGSKFYINYSQILNRLRKKFGTFSSILQKNKAILMFPLGNKLIGQNF